ncbi:MAG: glycoside hydrolase family 43 protein [Acidobacteriales bacterium]|nr:glycoside hydrolase family 43 protein [Terriglobales bacterium]
MKLVAVLLLVTFLCTSLSGRASDSVEPGANPSGTLVNPLIASGPDPWVTFRDGFYYHMHTTGVELTIWKTRSLAELSEAEKKVVWRAPAAGPYSHDIWAPELHYIGGKWYIYFAADAGTNRTHRLWVLENPSPDPFQGDWVMKGKVADPSDKWAIDGTVFENRGKFYLVWSGWEGDTDGVQNLYIARLKNPWTIAGKRTRLSTPEYPWEKVGDLRPKKRTGPAHVDINEGPAVLKHNGRIFLVYSACACWTDEYKLGMLTASSRSNLLKRQSWAKSSEPVFWKSPEASAIGPGHNSFFQSRDGKQDWILYHANSKSGQGCGGFRAPRAQPITWKPDGTPDFGRPVAAGQPIPAPE